MSRLLGLFRLLVLTLFATVSFHASAQTNISLAAGWNLAGNSSSTALDVTATFNQTANVNTVWKWIAPTAQWAIYAPSMSAAELQAFATSKGYAVLTTVNGGEGFWVNAKIAFDTQLPAGTAVTAASLNASLTLPGWNLISIGDNLTPAQVGQALTSPPITLWAWNAANSNWYFYAANLVAQGASALSDYISSKGYLNFGTNTLSPTTGFWVNMLAGSATVSSTTATSGSTSSTAAITTTTATVASTTTTTGIPGLTPPTGTAPVTISKLTSAEFAALTPTVTIGSVAINNGPPVVTFALSDGPANNNPIIGFGVTNQSATATLPGLAFLRFSIAKLVPGANGSPSKWVNYIVTTVPTKNATTGAVTASVPTRPTTEQVGTLVDHGNGTYSYTFYKDITKVKDAVAAATLTPPNVGADLGDLTYDPTLPHRLAIQISGNAPGTGTNTPNGVNSGITAVPLANPVNVIYDFLPSTGQPIAAANLTREVVAIASCNECHEKLTLHGSRIETKFCVVCHTDQRKYGYASVASAAGKFPALTETATVNATTGITSYRYAPATNRPDGEVAGDFTTMVHKIHNGAELVKENYNYANVAFNNKGFSMLGGGQKMCSKCHDSTKAVNANNWNTKPSRLACGACHDGIDWATGTGSTLKDKAAAGAVGAVLATSGHAGGAQDSDAGCAFCHQPDAGLSPIKKRHQTENVTKHNPAITAGLKSFTYEIKSAAVNASNDVIIQFKISAATAGTDGTLGASTPVTFLPAATPMANPLTGFSGSPSFLLAYTRAQDGITTPIDYNNLGVKQGQAISVSIAALLDTAKAADGSLSATADANGYYTATLRGTGTKKFPVGAKLRAVALQGYFTQTSAPASTTASVARHAIAVVKEVTGDTARRKVVDPEKCSNCHEWFEGHGGNRVYQTQVCVMCHVPALATSGRGIADTTLTAYAFSAADVKMLAGWGFDKTLPNAALNFPVTTNNFKDMIHGIHAGRERVTPFVDARDRTPSAITLLDFKRMDFPGRLNNCQTCHIAGTYSNVLPTALASTYESIDAAYAAGIAAGTATPAMAKTALSSASGTDKVTSPFTASCVSCHDSNAAQNHMVGLGGGMIKVDRSVFQANLNTIGEGESCSICHGAGRSEDIAVVHNR